MKCIHIISRLLFYHIHTGNIIFFARKALDYQKTLQGFLVYTSWVFNVSFITHFDSNKKTMHLITVFLCYWIIARSYRAMTLFANRTSDNRVPSGAADTPKHHFVFSSWLYRTKSYIIKEAQPQESLRGEFENNCFISDIGNLKLLRISEKGIWSFSDRHVL